MLATSLFVAIAALLPFAVANDRIPGSMFTDDPHGVAMAAVPMWHFGRPRGMVCLNSRILLLSPS